MALFFHSHCCNAICKGLGLEPFDLALKEKEEINSNSASVKSTSQTVKLQFCMIFSIVFIDEFLNLGNARRCCNVLFWIPICM